MKKILLILAMALALTASGVGAMAMPAPAQGVESSLPAGGPSVKALNGGVELSVPDGVETFVFYSITGQVIKQVQVSAGIVTVDLPRGCYIIKCSRWSKKVVVK